MIAEDAGARWTNQRFAAATIITNVNIINIIQKLYVIQHSIQQGGAYHALYKCNTTWTLPEPIHGLCGIMYRESMSYLRSTSARGFSATNLTLCYST